MRLGQGGSAGSHRQQAHQSCARSSLPWPSMRVVRPPCHAQAVVQPSSSGDDISKILANIDKKLGDHSKLLGFLYEDPAREKVAKLTSDGYAQHYTASSLVELVEMLPERDKDLVDNFKPLALTIAKRLVAEEWPEKLFFHIMRKLGQDWMLDVQGSVDWSSLGRFIGTCEDAPLISLLVRLRAVLQQPPPDRAYVLQEPDSAGIPCLLAASSSAHFLESAHLQLPSKSLEFDLRGHVRQSTSNGGSYVKIEVGEVKSALNLGVAVEQLGVRLNALKYCVAEVKGLPEQQLLLEGRLFVPHTGGLDQGASKLAGKAAREWGFLLFIDEL